MFEQFHGSFSARPNELPIRRTTVRGVHGSLCAARRAGNRADAGVGARHRLREGTGRRGAPARGEGRGRTHPASDRTERTGAAPGHHAGAVARTGPGHLRRGESRRAGHRHPVVHLAGRSDQRAGTGSPSPQAPRVRRGRWLRVDVDRPGSVGRYLPGIRWRPLLSRCRCGRPSLARRRPRRRPGFSSWRRRLRFGAKQLAAEQSRLFPRCRCGPVRRSWCGAEHAITRSHQRSRLPRCRRGPCRPEHAITRRPQRSFIFAGRRRGSGP